ncbi:hypothetical protein HDU79_004407 [Rhizoclosmatium sp. JEL0117]|nr:hypothetical protein HDU79_004407 [Rhizoclosmatium sp. JEL0117]
MLPTPTPLLPPAPPTTPIPHGPVSVATPASAYQRLREGLLGAEDDSPEASNSTPARIKHRPTTTHSQPSTPNPNSSNPNPNPNPNEKYANFATIDWIRDEAADRMRSRTLKRKTVLARVFNGVTAWIVVLLIGAAMGVCAAVIDIATIWLNDLRDGRCEAGFYLNKKFCCWHRPETNYTCREWIPWTTSLFLQCVIYTFFCIAFASLSALLVKLYAPYAAGEGIPEIKTILGGFVIKKFLGVWTLIIKIIGVTLSVGSGLSLGKEGPLVHIACCIGNIIARFFPKYRDNEAKKRHLLSAASAAAISVAFGAPVGGVLFSMEEISYYFPYKTMWRSFFCAMVGAIVLRLMNPFRTGKLVWFEVKLSRRWHDFELPAFILLGVLGGLVGAFFIKLNSQVSIHRKKYWRNYPILEVAIVALITGIIGFLHIYLRVSTVDLVANLFRECADITGDFHGLCTNPGAQVIFLLLFAAWIKFALTVITFGTQIPAGIFLPSITIGALVGRALGILMSMIQKAHPEDPFFTSCTIKPVVTPCITPATYSIIGAAAFLAGTTRMTMSLTVIMFELTGALSYMLPIMGTVLTAKWVADYVGQDGGAGLYGELIAVNGYPFLASGDEYIGVGEVGEIMTRVGDMALLEGTSMRVGQVEELLSDTEWKGFPIVVGGGDLTVVGFAGRPELQLALAHAKNAQGGDEKLMNFVSGDGDGTFTSSRHSFDSSSDDATESIDMRQWINATPLTFPVDFPISLCVEFFKKMGVRYVLITERESGLLAGILTKKDLLRHVSTVKDEMTSGGSGIGSPGQRRRPIVTNRSTLLGLN